MSLPKYPAYKDSGVEWLGPVPAHWNMQRLKYACTVFPSNVDKHSRDDESVVRLCNYTDVYYNERITSSMPFMEATASADQISKFTLKAGDTIITKDSETADDIAIAAYVPEDLPGVVCGYHLSMVRPRKGTSGAFVKRLFDSAYAKARFAVSANGLTRVGLGQYALDNVEFPFPPQTEQTAIAAFLDRETAKIDALIAEQEKLIALLAEKRQATISHAVTRGLDPDAPMKDSGVEWLGQVPTHWEIRPLKHLVSLKSGGTPSKANLDYWTDGEIPWASAKDLKTEVLHDTGDHLTELAIQDGAAELVEAGSALVVVRGMILARLFPVSVAACAMAINQDLKAVTPMADVTLSYLPWLLRGTAEETLRRLDEAGHGTKALRMDAWLSMKVPLPPSGEQKDIAGQLIKRLDEIDGLHALAVQANKLLLERRAALIAAAVTGQIDVRGLVDAPANPAPEAA